MWPVDDKAPFGGPSSTVMASREVAEAMPEQKEGARGVVTKWRSGAKSPEGVNKEKGDEINKETILKRLYVFLSA